VIAGARFSGNVRWASAACNSYGAGGGGSCDTSRGISAARVQAVILQQVLESGAGRCVFPGARFCLSRRRVGLTPRSGSAGRRYDAMVSMRSDIDAIMPGAFPFAFEFLYWEEIGVIDVELTRNLLICGGVVRSTGNCLAQLTHTAPPN
jgi:hypothetical protein